MVRTFHVSLYFDRKCQMAYRVRLPDQVGIEADNFWATFSKPVLYTEVSSVDLKRAAQSHEVTPNSPAASSLARATISLAQQYVQLLD